MNTLGVSRTTTVPCCVAMTFSQRGICACNLTLVLALLAMDLDLSERVGLILAVVNAGSFKYFLVYLRMVGIAGGAVCWQHVSLGVRIATCNSASLGPSNALGNVDLDRTGITIATCQAS